MHRAIENGIAFYHGRPAVGQGEVLLCDGHEGDGCLPSEYFGLVVELKGGLALPLPLLRLVHRLYFASSRVELSRMHGGLSARDGRALFLKAVREARAPSSPLMKQPLMAPAHPLMK